jgi:hypothetical protein
MISAQPHVQGRLIRAARDKVEQQFSFATRMRKIESIYRSVMKLDNSNQVRKCNILAAQ